MLIKRRFVQALALSIALTFSACGFHLRGSGSQPNLPFRSIYVGVADTSALGNELKRYIANAGGTAIANQPRAAEAIVEILSEARGKTILSLNSQGRIREYTLSYTVSFQVKDGKNNTLLAPTGITLNRNISFNEAEVLAKESEEAMLYRDMQGDMVQQIVRRLAAVKPAAAAS